MHPADHSLQAIITRLNQYWAEQGCTLIQPYDSHVGAGTFHWATTLRALGPGPWRTAYAQPCRRPADGRYGENPNRLQHYHQYQVLLKPAPEDSQQLYLGSLAAIGLNRNHHDIRFVEDDWESPTLGAWGLGWEIWCDGMEISQFTYFQQVGGIDCNPVSTELTYGLERIAMYIQGVENVFDLQFSPSVRYSELYHQSERDYSHYNFEHSDADLLVRHFSEAEGEAKTLTQAGRLMPAYDQALQASHLFNLLDARGVISVSERQGYILRVRRLVAAIAERYVAGLNSDG